MADTARLEHLRALVVDHLRRYGAEASRVVDVFAKTHGMHPTDLQALVLILNAERQGEPATPGTLRQVLNVTSGAVTGTVDRLVRAGHVRRVPDAHDRRQVRLHQDATGEELGIEFFGPLGARVDASMARYDEQQLELIEDFMRTMAEAMAEHRRSLEDGPPAS
ncbi:DNA-binding transcriptional regulator, MarR family [Friedmanniella luteola]|uniref:DNA-binding transcriptional regulator, MarR family n=1 Tax=Friedmanniella luteola TaxID=546871 RepID=A0A1H1MC88_9ACTN|nr:MarR family transcriptional regulator [Friedmanniella luteola]SDR84232.1 DNA-binding transcriptional regulator, MarR family [Friedmanniella luteola]